jgi:hypothetical protein
VGVVRAQEPHGIPTRNHEESRRGIQHDEPRNARNRRISRENPTSKCLRCSLPLLLLFPAQSFFLFIKTPPFIGVKPLQAEPFFPLSKIGCAIVTCHE